MQVPLELSFRDVPNTDLIAAVVREKVDKLERICDRLSSCRVVIERPQRHQETGNPYRVRIDMTVPPGHELVAKRESTQGEMHDPLEVVVREAFQAAGRRLERLSQRQHGRVKTHLHAELA